MMIAIHSTATLSASAPPPRACSSPRRFLGNSTAGPITHRRTPGSRWGMGGRVRESYTGHGGRDRTGVIQRISSGAPNAGFFPSIKKGPSIVRYLENCAGLFLANAVGYDFWRTSSAKSLRGSVHALSTFPVRFVEQFPFHCSAAAMTAVRRRKRHSKRTGHTYACHGAAAAGQSARRA